MKKYLVVYLDETTGHDWKVTETDEDHLEKTVDDVGAILNWNNTENGLHIISI